MAKLTTELAKVIDDISSAKYSDIVVQIGLIVSDAYSAIQCFRNNGTFLEFLEAVRNSLAPKKPTFNKFN